MEVYYRKYGTVRLLFLICIVILGQQRLLEDVDEKAESLRKVLQKYKKVPGDE